MLLWDSGATLDRNALGEEVDADIGVFGITVEGARRLGRDNAETELMSLFWGKLGRWLSSMSSPSYTTLPRSSYWLTRDGEMLGLDDVISITRRLLEVGRGISGAS
jgi:hypothetical protein